MVLNEKTGLAEVRSITLGVQNTEDAEVLSGLDEGDKIAAYTQTASIFDHIQHFKQQPTPWSRAHPRPLKVGIAC